MNIIKLISSKKFSIFIILLIINFFLVIGYSQLSIYFYDIIKTGSGETDKIIYYLILSGYTFIYIFFFLKVSGLFKSLNRNINIIPFIVNFNIIITIGIYFFTFYMELNSNLFFFFFYSLPFVSFLLNFLFKNFFNTSLKEDYKSREINKNNNNDIFDNDLEKDYNLFEDELEDNIKIDEGNNETNSFTNKIKDFFIFNDNDIDENNKRENQRDENVGLVDNNIFSDKDNIEDHNIDDFDFQEENNDIMKKEVPGLGFKEGKNVVIEDIDIEDLIKETDLLDNEFEIVNTDNVDDDSFLSITDDLEETYFNETDDEFEDKIEDIDNGQDEDNTIGGKEVELNKYHTIGLPTERMQDIELIENLVNSL